MVGLALLGGLAVYGLWVAFRVPTAEDVDATSDAAFYEELCVTCGLSVGVNATGLPRLEVIARTREAFWALHRGRPCARQASTRPTALQ